MLEEKKGYSFIENEDEERVLYIKTNEVKTIKIYKDKKTQKFVVEFWLNNNWSCSITNIDTIEDAKHKVNQVMAWEQGDIRVK